MAKFSISAAWEDTLRIVRGEGALLVPVALALVALPAILLEFLTPDARERTAAFRPSMLLMLPYLVATIAASLSLSLLALRRISVGEALRGAARRLPVAILASLFLAAACALLVLPVMPLLTGGEKAIAALNPAVSLIALIYLVSLTAGLIYVSVRLLLINTVIAVEPVGVAAAFRRTWALTRGRFWKLAAFFVIFLAATGIVGFAVMAAGGVVFIGVGRLLGDEALGKMLLLVLTSSVNALFSIFLVVMLASIYRQVAGSSNGT